MKLFFPTQKNIEWSRIFKRHTYPVVSIVICGVYLLVFATAIFFVVTKIRASFEINEQAAENQPVTFDLNGYETLAERFGIEPKK